MTTRNFCIAMASAMAAAFLIPETSVERESRAMEAERTAAAKLAANVAADKHLEFCQGKAAAIRLAARQGAELEQVTRELFAQSCN